MIYIAIGLIIIVCIMAVVGLISIGRNTWEDFDTEDDIQIWLKDNSND